MKLDFEHIPLVRRVYIAGPIGRTPKTHDNVLTAIHVAQEVREMGLYPYVPHLSYYWHCMYPREDWLTFDRQWLECCHALLRLPGESPVSDKEVKWAYEMDIEVFHSMEDLKNWYMFEKNKE